VTTSGTDETVEVPRCVKCRTDGGDVYRLLKCSMCFKLICEQCAIRNYGRIFCSKQCSMGYFLYEE
jgi:hypothetical protein